MEYCMGIAFITGITGQDGAYLAEFLLQKGYKVYGGFRRLSTPNFWRLNELNITNKIKLVEVDLLDAANLIRIIGDIQPDYESGRWCRHTVQHQCVWLIPILQL